MLIPVNNGSALRCSPSKAVPQEPTCCPAQNARLPVVGYRYMREPDHKSGMPGAARRTAAQHPGEVPEAL
jgi:hypothetical protein